MPANIDPIFTRTPDVSNNAGTDMNALVTAAANDYTGANANNSLIFTADATNGSFIRQVRFIVTATTANTASTATVGRVFISSVTSGATTNANTFMIAEITLPSLTADSSTAGASYIDIPLGFPIPASYTILVTTHAAPAANSAWRAVVIAGDY